MQKLCEIGEHETIARLSSMLGVHPDLVVGAGDDCAVCALPGTENEQVFTTDPVIENVHFTLKDQPKRIGNKAAGRVLSDIAAMGAQPQWMLINVVAPPELNFKRLEGIYEGILGVCRRFGATLIGGDLAQGSCLELHVFGTGVLPAGTALRRSGAMAGDIICVTGPLGKSIEGKHLDFVPCVEEGIWLRKSGLVHAMMDISDGLATDLRHMLKQSDVGAVLQAEKIPRVGTLEQALYDGEDFELLLSVAETDTDALCRQWREYFQTDLFRIGTITDKSGRLEMNGGDGEIQTLTAKAFEHFSENPSE